MYAYFPDRGGVRLRTHATHLVCLDQDALQKSLKLRRFRSNRDEIWRDCSSRHRLIWRHRILSRCSDGSHDVLQLLAAACCIMRAPRACLYSSWSSPVPFVKNI